MTARRWLLAGGVFAALIATAAWRWSAHRADAPSAGEADAVPKSRAQRAEPSPELASDGGSWNLQVVNALDDQPLPGAYVVVGRYLDGFFHHHPPPRFHGATDATGRILVTPPDDAPQPMSLHVSLPFFRPYRGEWAPGLRVVLEPLPPWKGRVVSASGAPAGGARVLGVDEDDAETTSDADGSFVLALTAPGRVLAMRDDQLAFATAVDGAPLTLTLAAPEQRTGVVRGRDGQPLGDVSITTKARALSWAQTTRADGVFRAPRLDGLELELHFEKPGYTPVTRDFTEEVVLSRPSGLEGTLVDQRGRPMPGVEVALGSDVAGYFIDEQTITTDDLGRFSFSELTEEAVTLRASAGEDADEEDAAMLTVPLPEGVVMRVTLALPPKRDELTVEYRSIADVEVSGCETLATPTPAAGWNSATNDDDVLLLSRGRYVFDVHCYDGRVANETREVDPRDATPLRFVVRQPDGGAPLRDELPPEKVRVKVVTQTGAPVAGAAIDCGKLASAESDAEGRATCEVRTDDQSWPMVVTATRDGLSGMTRTTGEDEAVVILRARVTLRGRVEGALPPGQWTLAVRSPQETSNQPLDGASFALEDRPAIRTFLCVEGERRSLGCAISEAGEEVVIHAGEPGKVTFTALDAAGAPIEYPVIYFDRQLRYPGDVENGAVELEAPPGDHVLILNVADSRARVETRFTVKPGEVTALGPLKLE